MKKIYVVSENREIDKESAIYKNYQNAIIKKSCELMQREYGIKANSGILSDLDGNKTYTLIERYDNQFANLNN